MIRLFDRQKFDLDFRSCGLPIESRRDEDLIGRIEGQFHAKALDIRNSESRLNAGASDCAVGICGNDFQTRIAQPSHC